MTGTSTEQIAHVTVEATVIRADGTREDLGVIAETTSTDPSLRARLMSLLTPWKG